MQLHLAPRKMNSKIFNFDDASRSPLLEELGGKGYSLVRMSQSGLQIPPGFVLAVGYFNPWVEQLKQTGQWKEFLASPPDMMTDRAQKLQSAGQDLRYTKEQEQGLKEALGLYNEFKFFAVRSSSPEEDLEGASFAGGYETILGVDRANIEDAVLRAFCSCLHPRVFVYKREQGFAIDDFKIAVVVQSQVDSEIAGVGFSLNPINNDYDEAVFNSNWGLGETVVAGLASPDQITVNKVNQEIVDFQIGGKETSIWLTAGGGTEERPDPRYKERTLADDQVLELTSQLCRIEDLYDKPMDIEWAYSGGKLYLLQARPITTHLPLPPALITKPGDRRRIYLDISLVVQALTEPISVLGLDFLRGFIDGVFKEVFGTDKLVDVEEGLASIEGGRLYLNLSNAAHVFGSFDKFADGFQNMDALTGEILRQVDTSVYKTPKRPDPIGKIGPQAAIRNPDIPVTVLRTALFPEKQAKRYRQKMDNYFQTLQQLEEQKLALKDYADRLRQEAIQMLVHTAIPTFAFTQKAMGKLKEGFDEDVKKDPDVQEQLERIDRSLPHNLTVEMGLTLFNMSRLLDPDRFKSKEELIQQFEAGDLSAEFKDAWKGFMDKFGHRGPGELDVATPRYRDNPQSLLNQVYMMFDSGNNDENAQERYDRCQKERLQAFEELSKIANKNGWFRTMRFKHLYRILETFGGYREHHKYFVICANGPFRERVLKMGEQLGSTGRLDNREQAFDLTIEELTRSANEPNLDLRSAAKKNTAFINQIKNRGDLPAVIDSRGRIFRPKRPPLAEGDLVGQPVSTGVVRGKVKILANPDEKPLLPGEILVARATDPGWTPLFVNAGGIVLEIGGMLQHGALVAREYGKPCIAGVPNATSEFKDGDYIEVDGSAGIIRRNLPDEETNE